MTAGPCRAKALATEPANLGSKASSPMSCVPWGKLLSLSEPPFLHMLSASQNSTDQIIGRALCRQLGAVYLRG